MNNYRYPGAQPFQGFQKDIFFGREKDIEELYELIGLEDHVILYSKSGLGKSSLLNAGILPRIKADDSFLPISIRFGAYSGKGSSLPVDISGQAIAREAKANSILDKIIDDDGSLWYYAKTLQLNSQHNGFILIFDQFEELFTYPEKAIYDFKQQLAELIHTEIPNRFREIIGKQFEKDATPILTEAELDAIHHPIEVKIIMSIRSDRMSLLHNLADFHPNILKSCYELHALNVEQAEEAILNPAFMKDERFITPPFDYEDEAIETILNYLTRDRSEKIESFQLQILCQALERKVIDQGLSKITRDELDNMEHIYENYYEDQINLLDTDAEKQAARILIEEGLIFDEEERRLSIYEGQIYASFGFTPELLNKLVNVHLLRAEPSLKGGYTYELSHDTIVAPILKAKRKRKAEESKAAEAAARAEREQEMAALRKLAEEERRKRIRARLVAVVGVALAVIAITATFFAVRFAQKANQQVFDLVEADYNRLLAEGQRLQRDGDYPAAIASFAEAKDKITDFQNQIDGGGIQAQEAIVTTEELQQKDIQYDSLFTAGKAYYEAGGVQLLAALNSFEEARALDINNERNKQAELEIEATNRLINNTYKNHKALGDRFRDVGEIPLACQNYTIASTLRPEDQPLQQLISRLCH